MPEKKQKIQSEAEHKTDTHNIAWEAGKFCLDIAKLVFGGVILVGLMRQELKFTLLFAVGLAVVFVFIGTGFFLLKHSKKTK